MIRGVVDARGTRSTAAAASVAASQRPRSSSSRARYASRYRRKQLEPVVAAVARADLEVPLGRGVVAHRDRRSGRARRRSCRRGHSCPPRSASSEPALEDLDASGRAPGELGRADAGRARRARIAPSPSRSASSSARAPERRRLVERVGRVADAGEVAVRERELRPGRELLEHRDRLASGLLALGDAARAPEDLGQPAQRVALADAGRRARGGARARPRRPRAPPRSGRSGSTPASAARAARRAPRAAGGRRSGAPARTAPPPRGARRPTPRARPRPGRSGAPPRRRPRRRRGASRAPRRASRPAGHSAASALRCSSRRRCGESDSSTAIRASS